MTGWLRALVLASVCLIAASASATEQAELLARAEAAERRFDPAAAAQSYREALAASPSSRLARRIRARLEWIEARREGDYRPLAALLRMRRTRTDAAAIERFEREAASFPEGRVRCESLELVADGYLRRLDRPADALRAYEAWAQCPGIDEAERQLAESGIALARLRREGVSSSLAGLERSGLRERPEASFLRAERLARPLRMLAGMALFAFLWAALRLVRRQRPPVREVVRRALTPARLGAGVWVLFLPLVLVWRYDWRLVPKLTLVMASAGLMLLCASLVGAVHDQAAAREQARLLPWLGAAATLGAFFLALDRTGMWIELVMALEESP